MAILEGKARGGPRDGVKLMCPHTWDGRIIKDNHGPVYYPGHYEAEFTQTDNGIICAWVWEEKKAVLQTPTPPTPVVRTRQAFAGYKYR